MPNGGFEAYSDLLPELEPPAISPIDPDAPPQYLADRRALLGPIADITHPEFGRENRPEENFAITYEVEVIDEKRTTVHVHQTVTNSSGEQVHKEFDSDRSYQGSNWG